MVGFAGGRPVGILIGALADAFLADPRRGHPVAGFGRCATALESITYRDSRTAGAAHTAALVALVTAAGPAMRGRQAPTPRALS